MDNTLNDALLLMLVGMTSVFTVLTIVVAGGNMLIKLVNSVTPQTTTKKVASSSRKENLSIINKQTLAVISASVLHLTNGKGKIDKITKI